MNETERRVRWALKGLRATSQKGTGMAAGGMGAGATDRLADLDACTQAYRAWNAALIPGLLQTPSYAAGAIKARTPSLDPAEIGLRVTHRRRRADRFLTRRTETDALAWFLVGEDAIRRPMMNAHSHAEQLRHLLEITDQYPNVKVQVLPVDSPVSSSIEPFSIFHLEDGPTVAHLEVLIGGFYTTAAESVARLRTAFSEMIGCALSTSESRQFISEELETCWGATTAPPSSSPRTVTPIPASTSPDPTPEASE